MARADWKAVVLQSLEQRDTRELVSADVYDACYHLGTLECSDFADLKLANAYATIRVEGLPGIPPATSRTLPHASFPSLIDRDEQGTLKAQVAELYKTQNAHLQTIKSLETRLASVQDVEQRLKQEFGSQTAFRGTDDRLAALRERRNDLELRAVLHGETLREKNQQIQVLQDELLTTGITLNVLEARASKLEEENKELLDRWLAKVKADADSLNEANEFLEQIRGMRMASPIIGGEDATASLEENRGESKE